MQRVFHRVGENLTKKSKSQLKSARDRKIVVTLVGFYNWWKENMAVTRYLSLCC